MDGPAPGLEHLSPPPPPKRRIQLGWRLWEKPWPIRVLATLGGAIFGYVGVYLLLEARNSSSNVQLVAVLCAIWAGLGNGAGSLGVTWQRPSDAPDERRRRWAYRLRLFMIAFGVVVVVTVFVTADWSSFSD